MYRARATRFVPVLLCATLLVACHDKKKSAKPAPSAKPPAPSTLKPPPTPKHDVVEHYFSAAVMDPYRWLEDGKAPAVKKWIAAQNGYADKVLGSFPERTAIEKRVRELSLTSTDRFDPSLAAGRLFFLEQTPPQQQAVLASQPWPKGKANVLYDPNKSRGTAITIYWPSADGRYVAYGTAEGGSEATTIHVVRASDGKQLPDRLPHAGGGTTPQALAWDADAKGFVYVRLPLPGTVKPAELQFNAAIYHHELGKPAKDDKLVFGQDLSPVAEYSFAVSGDGKHRALLVHFGDGSPARVYLEHGEEWKRALGPDSNVRDDGDGSDNGGAASWLGDKLLVITHQAAPRGRVLALDEKGRMTQLVPQRKWAMHGIYAIKGGFVLVMVHGPTWRVDQYDEKGKKVRSVPLPAAGISVNDVASSDQSDQVLFSYSGWTIAGRWARYDAAAGKLSTIFSVKSPADYSKVKTQLLTAVSRDGAHVPVTVLSLEGTKPDGKRPTILTGYGGYGVVVGPRFLGPYLTWLEHGGVYAVANIRGGGEFGEGWHEDGMLEDKQNDFDDSVRRGTRSREGRLDRPKAPRHHGRLERRTAHGRRAHAAPQRFPRRRQLRRHLRHVARRAVAQRTLQRQRVRHCHEGKAVRLALRLLTAAPHQARRCLSRRAARDRRKRPARRALAVPQVRRGAAGGHHLEEPDRAHDSHERRPRRDRLLQPARRQQGRRPDVLRPRARAERQIAAVGCYFSTSSVRRTPPLSGSGGVVPRVVWK